MILSTSNLLSAISRERCPIRAIRSRIVDEALHRLDQRVHGTRRHEESIFSFDDGLTAARCVGRDDRPSHRHRFEHAPRGSFAVARKHIDVTCGEVRANIGHFAVPDDIPRLMPTFHFVGGNGVRVAVNSTHEMELHIGSGLPDPLGRRSIFPNAFGREHAGDQQEL